MARNLTTEQRALLRESNLDASILTTWWLDSGTVRLCDWVDDLTDGTDTWIGANAIAACSEIRSGSGLASESVTITLDGTRMIQSGFTDPSELFDIILAEPMHNRRVDIAIGLKLPTATDIGLVLPIYAGLVNNARLTDPKRDALKPGDQQQSTLEITMDSLASRYNWISGRTRSHQDQQEIDPTDMFFQYTQVIQGSEQTLYWGMNAPRGNSTYNGGGGGGSTYQQTAHVVYRMITGR